MAWGCHARSGPADINLPKIPLFGVLFELLTDALHVASILVLDLSATLEELLKLGKERELRLHSEFQGGQLVRHLPTDVCREKQDIS